MLMQVNEDILKCPRILSRELLYTYDIILSFFFNVLETVRLLETSTAILIIIIACDGFNGLCVRYWHSFSTGLLLYYIPTYWMCNYTITATVARQNGSEIA